MKQCVEAQDAPAGMQCIYDGGRALVDEGWSLVDLTESVRWKADPHELTFMCSFEDDVHWRPRVGMCVYCFEAEAAYWIFEVCGHKCVCKRCMRKAKKPDKEDRRSQGKPGSPRNSSGLRMAARSRRGSTSKALQGL